MSEKLSWDYDQHSGEQRAMYRGFRIWAVRDDDARNPFTEEDGHWPMVVLYDRTATVYDNHAGMSPTWPLGRFTPAQMVHDQKAIGAAVGVIDGDFQSRLDDGEEMRKWWTDDGFLEACFADAFEGLSRRGQLEACEKLYGLLGIPCLNTTSRGYSQGDYAELLIVATPEAQEALRSRPADMTDEAWAKAIGEDLEAQADLYGAWAWGDVYGYIVEQKVSGRPDEEDDEPEWEEVEDGACWGYYGTDHDKSGLEEAARAVVDSMLSRKEAA